LRLATLAKPFDMRVIATRRDQSKGAGAADKIVGGDGLLDVLRQADFVALTRPLTPKTENLIDAKALAAMKRSICGETSEPGPFDLTFHLWPL